MLGSIRQRFEAAWVNRPADLAMVQYAPLPDIRTSLDDELEVEDAIAYADDERPLSGKGLPGPKPTASQAVMLRRVPGSLPWTTYAIALVELAERASYYGVTGISSNFIQRPLPPGGLGTGAPAPGSETTPGALGMGLQMATSLTTLFTLLGYTTPLLGGALADVKWGKFRTIMIGAILVTIGHVLTVFAAMPSLLQSRNAFLPFLLAMLLVSSSTGLIKANVAPIMAEQYAPTGDYVECQADGEKVIVDREATIQRVMSAYYGSINIGAFFAISSTLAEKYVGFWLAFLIPGVICLVMPFLLLAIHPRLAPSPPPASSPLIDTLTSCRPTVGLSDDEHALEEDKRSVKEVCIFFLYFVVYNVADGGLNSLVTSLAGSMTTSGIPNDFLLHANPFAVVVSIPVLNRYVYPFLQTRGIEFGPIRRVVFGFALAAIAMGWSALLQQLVYDTSPCGYSATVCDEETGVSHLSAWLVLPTPVMLGISEAIAVVSAMEIGYLMSPPGMRAILNAVFLFTQSLGAILVLVLVPLMRDPLLVLPFLVSSVAVIIASFGVWRRFGHLDLERH